MCKDTRTQWVCSLLELVGSEVRPLLLDGPSALHAHLDEGDLVLSVEAVEVVVVRIQVARPLFGARARSVPLELVLERIPGFGCVSGIAARDRHLSRGLGHLARLQPPEPLVPP